MLRPLATLALIGLLAACTTPRPPLPDDGSFVPPPEAHFNERPDAIVLDPRQPYDATRFRPPVYSHQVPGSQVVSPRNLPGPSDAYVYFVIEKDGHVRQVKVVVKTGQPELDESIERQVMRWRFTPGTLDGVPVAVATGTIFRLQVREGI